MSEFEEQLDVVVDDYLRYRDGDGPMPDLSGLPDRLRSEALARFQFLDALWGEGVQPPSDDPVARRLGFDRLGEDIAINGLRVASIRKARDMDLKQLRMSVLNAGGSITPGDLFRLEQSSSTVLPQPTVSAFVAALGSSIAELKATAEVERDIVRVFLDGPTFNNLVAVWAAEQSRDVQAIRPVVQERVLAAQYRASEVTIEQLVEITRAILDSLEA